MIELLKCEGCDDHKSKNLCKLQCGHQICFSCINSQAAFIPKVRKQGFAICYGCGMRFATQTSNEETLGLEPSHSHSETSEKVKFQEDFKFHILDFGGSLDLFEDGYNRSVGTTPKQRTKPIFDRCYEQSSKGEDPLDHKSMDLKLLIPRINKGEGSRQSILEVSEGGLTSRSNIARPLILATQNHHNELPSSINQNLQIHLKMKWLIPSLCPNPIFKPLYRNHQFSKSKSKNRNLSMLRKVSSQVSAAFSFVEDSNQDQPNPRFSPHYHQFNPILKSTQSILPMEFLDGFLFNLGRRSEDQGITSWDSREDQSQVTRTPQKLKVPQLIQIHQSRVKGREALRNDQTEDLAASRDVPEENASSYLLNKEDLDQTIKAEFRKGPHNQEILLVPTTPILATSINFSQTVPAKKRATLNDPHFQLGNTDTNFSQFNSKYLIKKSFTEKDSYHLVNMTHGESSVRANKSNQKHVPDFNDSPTGMMSPVKPIPIPNSFKPMASRYSEMKEKLSDEKSNSKKYKMRHQPVVQSSNFWIEGFKRTKPEDLSRIIETGPNPDSKPQKVATLQKLKNTGSPAPNSSQSRLKLLTSSATPDNQAKRFRSINAHQISLTVKSRNELNDSQHKPSIKVEQELQRTRGKSHENKLVNTSASLWNQYSSHNNSSSKMPERTFLNHTSQLDNSSNGKWKNLENEGKELMRKGIVQGLSRPASSVPKRDAAASRIDNLSKLIHSIGAAK